MSRSRRSPSSAGPFLIIGGASAIALFWLCALYFALPKLLAYVIAINAMTLFAYGFDKFAAGKSWRRLPEKLLHTLAFLGGSPAALIGQRLFHHKTIKRSFRQWFWGIIVVQGIAVGVWVYWKYVRGS